MTFLLFKFLYNFTFVWLNLIYFCLLYFFANFFKSLTLKFRISYFNFLLDRVIGIFYYIFLNPVGPSKKPLRFDFEGRTHCALIRVTSRQTMTIMTIVFGIFYFFSILYNFDLFSILHIFDFVNSCHRVFL